MKRRKSKADRGRAAGAKEQGRPEEIAGTVRKAKAVDARIERVKQDERQVEEDELALAARGGSRQVTRTLERRAEKVRERKLRLLERDDEYIEQALKEKRALDSAALAEGTTNADELLYVIVDELELLPLFEDLSPPATRTNTEGKEVKRRFMYPSVVLNLVSLLSRFLGLGSGPEVQAQVLCDPRWMTLLGFTLEEIREGATKRSAGLRGKTREGGGGRFVDADELGPVRTRIDDKGSRGAFSSQTLAGHESDLPEKRLERFFNGIVRAIANKGFFPGHIRTSLDTTDEEVVPSLEEAGKVKKKTKVTTKARRPKKVEVMIRGFKVWVLMEVETGLPLALKFATIERPDNEFAREVVDQAIANLEGYSTIVSVALDRGFLDGDLLYWLKTERDIEWVCPAKENMEVTKEARERVTGVLQEFQAQVAASAAEQRAEAPLETASRLAGLMEEHDGVRFFQRCLRDDREPLIVAQVNDLYYTDFYGPGGSSSSRVHSKSFRPTPLHATVVLNWPDRARTDRQDQLENDEEGKGPVVILSASPEAGLTRYDRYDERSLIENRVNRDGKQFLGLGTTLARNAAAVRSATYFSTVALMLYRVLRLLQEAAEEAFDRRGEQLGILRYRREVLLKNRGKVIISTDGRFGFVPLTTIMALGGFAFR